MSQHVVVRGPEQGCVPPESVDDISREQSAFGVGEGHPCTEKGGVEAAPVDVPDEQHRCPSVIGHAHVDQIVALEVDLAGAARAFKNDDVAFGREAVIRVGDGGPEFPLFPEIFEDVHMSQGLPEDDDLRSRIRVRLEQNGIHARIGVCAGRLRLHDLCPAHLVAIGRDARIQRHVLSLERGHIVAVLPEDAAVGRCEDALARV